MYRLGDVISSMREDFIVVHLAEPCSYCRSYISDAKRCAPASSGLVLWSSQCWRTP